jgi:UDP-N-acetylglucosamine--N-acetylmuramyl-(pentapeptide) pyrophosphoryl-undecaprenol N-acetylglucosamine transferase
MTTSVLIMAGGTGGHVYPALAVARRLTENGVRVTWLGTRRGIEARAVPASGLPINMEWLTIRGVRRSGWRAWLRLPFTLTYALWQAWRVLRRVKPDAVLSMGGFVAGPGGVMAWLTRVPLVVHEQNAVPGLTNRVLAALADRVLSGFPGAFGSLAAARHVGNPVRREIAELAPPETRLAERSGRLQLLVIGGSQGTKAFNDIVRQAVCVMPAAARPEVWHQCGRGMAESTQAAYGDCAARVVEFIDDMASAFSWADLVLCRAGAMTVAEVAAAGVAAILVPYPHAVDDHQTANARLLVEADAATLLPQTELTAERLATVLSECTDNRELILKMARAARSLAIVDADEVVAHEVSEVAT